MRALSVSCVLLVLCSRVAVAQFYPDLSGRWILENPSAAWTDVALELTVQQIERTTSVRGEPLKETVTFLVVDRRLATGSRIDRYQPGTVGGTVAGLAGVSGETRATTRHSTKWEGRVLVITTADLITNTEREERWSLEDAALVVTVTTRANGSDSTIRLVYRH